MKTIIQIGILAGAVAAVAYYPGAMSVVLLFASPFAIAAIDPV